MMHTNKLLSEKISQLSKSSPDSTYTLKQVTDMRSSDDVYFGKPYPEMTIICYIE